MPTETVVVSGAAGFIGTRVIPRLLDAGHAVVALDNLHSQVHPEQVWPEELDPRAQRVRGSVESIEPWLEAFDLAGDAPTVLHLAAETGTGQSLTEARRHASVNVLGTAALTDALVLRGISPRSVVLTSSRAVYGEGAWLAASGEQGYPSGRTSEDLDAQRWAPLLDGAPAVEPLPHEAATTVPGPTNVYAATKLAQEHLLSSWCSAMGVPLSVLRLQNVYGAGQALANSYTGVLTFFATRSVAGLPIEVYEGGGILRDFVHVSDVAAALAAAIEAPGALERPVDIGSGRPVTLQTVAEVMARLAGAPEPIITTKYRLGDVRAAFASIEAAQRALGYQPSVSLEEGLTGLLEFARA
jgi:dTDP-L-rhamnose 4-epimerase